MGRKGTLDELNKRGRNTFLSDSSLDANSMAMNIHLKKRLTLSQFPVTPFNWPIVMPARAQL